MESAEATLESAKLNVEFTKVRSLIDGVAGQAAIQVGNLVSASSQLVEVSQINPIKVYFFISEQEYMSLSARARAQGKTDLLSSGDTLPLKLTLANNQIYVKTGRVISVDRAVTTEHSYRGELCESRQSASAESVWHDLSANGCDEECCPCSPARGR